MTAAPEHTPGPRDRIIRDIAKYGVRLLKRWRIQHDSSRTITRNEPG
ncbi:hypothetical protein LWC34_45070 [Kibdelosporangium philippinense]|uniref:Transposase n=1 Tax=Kibdelosporangium philippinense TaxID=211113 RepID=A0ABS8ZQA4_9PSEU|nr:hypothetical protein [Kibdelosporangium philippinense]